MGKKKGQMAVGDRGVARTECDRSVSPSVHVPVIEQPRQHYC